LYDLFLTLPLIVQSESFYRAHLPRARSLIERRDPSDVDLLALALRAAVPVWTNDRDFDGIPDIEVVSTAELLAILGV
jgi:predicted nucleic acid-binding protein